MRESNNGNVESILDAHVTRLKRALGDMLDEPANSRVTNVTSALIGVPPSIFNRALMRLRPEKNDVDEIRAYIEVYENNKKLNR